MNKGRYVLLAVMAVAAASAWHWRGSGAAAWATGAMPDASVVAVRADLGSEVPAAMAVATSAAAGDAPPGVSPPTWARLREELSARPEGQAELRRLAGYYAYADTLARFRGLRAGQGDLAERIRLARTLDEGLDEHLRQGELSGGEARLIKLAVLEATEPDPERRGEQLAAWASSVEAAGATANRDADAGVRIARARDEAFQRAQAELVAAWTARGDAARDPAGLAQALDDLRQRRYATP